MAPIPLQGRQYLKGWLAALLLTAGACAWHSKPDPQDALVDIDEVGTDILVDIRYATAENFTKRILYPANRCLLRSAVAERLVLVHKDLAKKGLGLKVWDCYRPLSIQKKLWELVPDPRYVADPKQGSRHNRGAAVDATLVNEMGEALEMPTPYDDFSEKAHRGWAGASAAARKNSALLEDAMKRRGFAGLATEWWHFDAEGWAAYPVTNVPLDGSGELDGPGPEDKTTPSPQ